MLRFRGKRQSIAAALVLLGFSIFGVGRSSAQNGPDFGERFEVGIGGRFMPVGWFDLEDQWGRSFRAYPALGMALFLDYRLTSVFSVGFSPEVTLNIIPNYSDYVVGTMYGFMARFGVRYPSGHFFEPYGTLGCGYSMIVREHNPTASGLAGSVSAGVLGKFAKRHAVFLEVSFMLGLQRINGSPYAPSYLVTSLGWRLGL